MGEPSTCDVCGRELRTLASQTGPDLLDAQAVDPDQDGVS